MMKTKITSILLFLLIMSAALPVYYTYRSRFLERDYIEQLSAKNSNLQAVADKINSEESPDTGKVTKLFNDIIIHNTSIAALAVTDRAGRLKFMVKNDSLLLSGRIVDELVKDIKDGAFRETGGKSPAVRNYSGTDWLTERLYIYGFSSSGRSTLAVYSFTADRMMKIRLALEVILVLSGAFIITGGLVIIMVKTGILKESYEYRIRTIVIGEKSLEAPSEKSPGIKKAAPAGKAETGGIKTGYKAAAQIRESDLSPIDETESIPDEKGEIKKTQESVDTTAILNQKTFALFKKIHKKMSPESISLYIKMTENTLSKTYELKGKSLIRIDSITFESIPVSEIERINKPGTYITGSGETVRIPLICDGTITGLVEINTGENNSTVNLSFDQSELSELAREIKNYIDRNNLITDMETGFFSSVNFVNCVTERIKNALSGGEGFSLLIINIFSGVDADRKQKNMILKVLHPVLRKAAGSKNPVFLHKDCISLILGNNVKEGQSIEAALVKEISRFRLKISDDNIVKMNPQSILRSSADSGNVRNILHEVEALASVNN